LKFVGRTSIPHRIRDAPHLSTRLFHPSSRFLVAGFALNFSHPSIGLGSKPVLQRLSFPRQGTGPTSEPLSGISHTTCTFADVPQHDSGFLHSQPHYTARDSSSLPHRSIKARQRTYSSLEVVMWSYLYVGKALMRHCLKR
jgi:hypothetical protein